jgi:hypothetical protein
MTRSLPFAVQPVRRMYRIGNEDSGIIEMPICGGLLRKEREHIEALTRTDDSLFVLSARSAAKISEAEGISLSEAVEALQGGGVASGPLMEIRLRHADELQVVIDASLKENHRFKFATITAMMRVRGGLPDWEVEDWEGQPDVIIDGVYALAQLEMAAEPSAQPTPVTEELLGKQPPEKSEAPRSTGKRASGI